MHQLITTISTPVRRAVRRTSSAHAIAAVALVAACTGSAYAAATIGSAQVVNNSLRGIDIRNGSLTGADIKNGAIYGADIKDGNVASADIRDNDVTTDDIADGTVGSNDLADAGVAAVDLAPDSVDSAKVADGTLAAADLSDDARGSLSNSWTIRGTMKSAAGGAHVTEDFLCDFANGERAAGGGGYSYFEGKGYLTKSTPVYGSGAYNGQPIGWQVSMQNLSGATNYLIVRVTCVKG